MSSENHFLCQLFPFEVVHLYLSHARLAKHLSFFICFNSQQKCEEREVKKIKGVHILAIFNSNIFKYVEYIRLRSKLVSLITTLEPKHN